MNAPNSSRRSDFEIVLRVLRRRRVLIIGCATLVTAAALGFSLVATKQYTATATLVFVPSQPNQALNSNDPPPQALSDRDAATNEKLVSLYGMDEATAAALSPRFPGVSAGTVNQDVTVSSEGTSNLVDISATTSTPKFSADIANTYARQFIVARVQAARSAYAQAQNLIAAQLTHPASLSSAEVRTLQTQEQQLRLLSVMQTGNANLAQPAGVPKSPSSPLVKRNTLLGLLLGMVLGVSLGLLLERLDRRIKDVDDLEATLGLPVVGIVPEGRSFDDAWGSSTLPAREEESFRMLRARLRYFNVDRDIRSLLVTSAAPNDGKSTIAYHLARTAASTKGTRVILVEADLRKPRIAPRTGLEASPGLAELLTQNLAVEDVVQRVPAGHEDADEDQTRNLDVIVAGSRPPNPSELIESQKMSQLLDRLKADYDLVVVDTPPAAVVADAIPLVGQADGVLIVARLNHSTTTGIRRLHDQLNSLGAPLLGAVANHFVATRGDDYEYGYGYGYYSAGKPTRRRLLSRQRSRVSNGRSPSVADEDPTSSPLSRG